jgi:enoyl-CoA hydratase/carnithine racemase
VVAAELDSPLAGEPALIGRQQAALDYACGGLPEWRARHPEIHLGGSTVHEVAGLRIERDARILRVTLARPEKRNALSPELIDGLAAAFADVGDARAVVLSGEGPTFSAGADIEWMRASIDLTPEQNTEDARRLDTLFHAADTCAAPVVAAVRGHTAGGGCGLLCCCDIVLATPDATFAFSEAKLGLIPAVIAPYVLARIGSGAARRLFLTGERFAVETALRVGLLDEVAADLDAEVGRVVGELLSSGPETVRLSKRLARGALPADEAARLIAERRRSDEAQEGLRAFLERRPASWMDG